MTDVEFKYMTEEMAVDLAELLSKDFGMNVSDSLNALYNSATYAKLLDARSGLYFQSPGYVYSFLKNELTSGKMK